jgi:LPS sulfotransferase NodH
MYISAMRLKLTKVAHVTSISSSQQKRLEINTEKMLQFFRAAEQLRNNHRSRFSKDRAFLEITYELLIAEPLPTIASILAFLGVRSDTPPAPPTIKKIASNVLADEVSNSTDVAATLQGTPFEVYLVDYADYRESVKLSHM